MVHLSVQYMWVLHSVHVVLCKKKSLIVALQAGGYGKVITHVIIGLKTVKGTKQLKLDPTIYDSLQKEKVLPGDVIYIEANSGESAPLKFYEIQKNKNDKIKSY